MTKSHETTQRPKANDIRMLKKRADFLRLRHAGSRPGSAKRGTKSCLLQMATAHNTAHNNDFAQVGYTVTKKIGNAVVRNRIKRRFRAAVRDVFPDKALSGHQYVLIARPDAVHRSYENIRADLLYALDFTENAAYPEKTNAC